MKRVILAALFAAIAAAALALLDDGTLRGWTAAIALSSQPETISVIETDDAADPLEAALTLRAVLRFAPIGVVFLDPLKGSDGAPLLTSKLEDVHIPVVFTSNDSPVAMQGVTITAAMPSLPAATGAAPAGWPSGCVDSAPQGEAQIVGRRGRQAIPSNILQILLSVHKASSGEVAGTVPGAIHAGPIFAPVNASGRSGVNPLAAHYVQRIRFDQLMERTERSERGEISAALENLFHGQLIAVEKTGSGTAIGLVALHNGFTESDAPLPGWIGVFLTASLPFWAMPRITRALLALLVACVLLLIAVAVYQQFRVVVPLTTLVLLPFLALIPGGPNRRVVQLASDLHLT